MKGKTPGPGGEKMDVPGPNELRPSPREAQPGRGKLGFVISGYAPVHDYGAPKAPYDSLYPDYHQPTRSATSSASVSHPDADAPAAPQPTTAPAKIR
jgi:hypothetical protein